MLRFSPAARSVLRGVGAGGLGSTSKNQRPALRSDRRPLSNYSNNTPAVKNAASDDSARLRPSVPIKGLMLVTIPSGRKAMVTSYFGSRDTVVEGPATVFRGCEIKMFRHYVIDEGSRVSVFDESGREVVVDGPASVNLHPDSTLLPHPCIVLDEEQKVLVTGQDGMTRVVSGPVVCHLRPRESAHEFLMKRLAVNEAICIIRQSGQREVIRGADQPRVWIDPRETLLTLALTAGGDPDGLNKKPGSLRIDVIRLEPSQAYFAFPVRTADNTVLIMKLCIFWHIDSPEQFVSNNDPFGAVFNHIMSDLTGETARLPFDELTKDPNKRIAERYAMPERVAFALDTYGIAITSVQLRGWKAEDAQVQCILDQATAAQTERELGRAKHIAALERLQQHREELEQGAANNGLEIEAAQQIGRRQAAELAAFIQSTYEELLAGSLCSEDAFRVIKLYLAAKGVENGGKLQLTSAL